MNAYKSSRKLWKSSRKAPEKLDNYLHAIRFSVILIVIEKVGRGVGESPLFIIAMGKIEENRGVRMAKGGNTESRVLPIVEAIVAESNVELVDVEFVKEGANWYLRIYIDKEGGVDIVDCETVSRGVEGKLDEKDPIEQAYILEVSSPGIDRPLKKDADFEKFKGEIVDVKLYKAQNGSKEYQGTLLGLVEKVISIEDEDGETVAFEQKDVAKVKLAVIF